MIPYITKVTINFSDGTEVRGRLAALYQCEPSKNHHLPQTLINVLFDTPTVAPAPPRVNIGDTTKYYEYSYKGVPFSGVPAWFATVVYPDSAINSYKSIPAIYKG